MVATVYEREKRYPTGRGVVKAYASVRCYGSRLQAMDRAWRDESHNARAENRKAEDALRVAHWYDNQAGFTQTRQGWLDRAAQYATQAKRLERYANRLRGQLHKVIIEALEVQYPGVRFEFSQYAGCSCPCSPGYKIMTKYGRDSGYILFVDVTADPESYAQENHAENAAIKVRWDRDRITKEAIQVDGAGI